MYLTDTFTLQVNFFHNLDPLLFFSINFQIHSLNWYMNPCSKFKIIVTIHCLTITLWTFKSSKQVRSYMYIIIYVQPGHLPSIPNITYMWCLLTGHTTLHNIITCKTKKKLCVCIKVQSSLFIITNKEKNMYMISQHTFNDYSSIYNTDYFAEYFNLFHP